MIYEQVMTTTEIRRHNGQCEYGEWLQLEDAPVAVVEAVADEVLEAMCHEMRHEPQRENTDDAGSVEVGGQRWVYRR